MSPSKSSGTLKSYPLARLLMFVHRKGYNGALQFATNPVATIFFRGGRPVFVDFVSAEDLLGRLVVQAHAATEEMVSEALARQDAERRLLGHILVDMGVDSQALLSILAVQQKRKLTRLFFLEDARFEFKDLKLPDVLARDAEALAQDTEGLVWQVLSTIYTEDRSIRELAPLESMVLSLPRRPALPASPTQTQTRALDRLQAGAVTLEELRSLGRSREVRTLVYWLWASGHLTVDIPRGAGAQAGQVSRMTAAFKSVAAEARAQQTARLQSSRGVAVQGASPGAKLQTEATPPPAEQPQASKKAAPIWPFPPLPDDASEEAKALYDAIRSRYIEVRNQDLFQVLGVPRNATKAQIKQAYLALAKQFHPDRAANLGGDELREPADALFQRISEAYMTLSDDAEREEYRRILEDDSLAGDRDKARLVMQAELDFQKGEVFLRKGDLDQAERFFSRALEANPEEGEHVALVAWTRYLKAKRQKRESEILQETRKALEKAVEISPKCARIHYFLGKIHQALGDDDRALENFQRAVALNKHYLEPAREIHIMEIRRNRSKRAGRKSSLWERIKGK